MGWPTLNSSLDDTPDMVTKAQQKGDSKDKPMKPKPAISPEDYLQDAPSNAEDEESPREENPSEFDIRSQRQNLPRLDTTVGVSRVLRGINFDPISPTIDPKARNEHGNFASPSSSSPSVSETQKEIFRQ